MKSNTKTYFFNVLEEKPENAVKGRRDHITNMI